MSLSCQEDLYTYLITYKCIAYNAVQYITLLV